MDKPVGMDHASWALIQKLQQQEARSSLDVITPPSISSAGISGDIACRERERRDEVLAWSLQQQEEPDGTQRCRIREEMDMAVAWKLQQEEDRKSERICKQEGFERRDMFIALQLQQEEEDQIEHRDMLVALQLQIDEEDQGKKGRPHPSREQVLDALEPCQRKAVRFVKEKAKVMHDFSLPSLERRVVGLGFTTETLYNCLEYIRDDAPIIIHLKETTLSKLSRDTHYRSLFETNTSGGSTSKSNRIDWETGMFGNCYNGMTCKPFDRPKYGCLNISGDIEGVASARRYGRAFMILHQHVRHRTTFFNKDTGDFVATQSLATNNFYAHVLEGYNDTELIQVLNVCSSARVGGARSQCSNYKEVQIHGPVCLATDVQALSVPGRERTASYQLKRNILAFQECTKCNILWQEDLLNPETTIG